MLQSQFGWTGPQTLADIGSGTGISSELFLQFGDVVYGVEPNRNMREAAKTFLAEYRTNKRTFHSVDGTAEGTTLPDASVDGVVAGQAFHWFDPEQARHEFLRILRPGGWAALIWNTRQTTSTPFMRTYEDLLQEIGTDYRAVRHENIPQETFKRFFRGGHQHHVLPNLQRFNLEGLRGRLLSSSYAPPAGHPDHEPMLAALERIFADHQTNGTVDFEYETQLYAGYLSN
jgi:SAM-dependent methyltransferase